MRCYICDWSPTGDVSFYNETLQLTNTDPTRLIYLDDGKPVCTHCHTESKLAASVWDDSENPPEEDPEDIPLEELESLE
jgi:hypothetical protein